MNLKNLLVTLKSTRKSGGVPSLRPSDLDLAAGDKSPVHPAAHGRVTDLLRQSWGDMSAWSLQSGRTGMMDAVIHGGRRRCISSLEIAFLRWPA